MLKVSVCSASIGWKKNFRNTSHRGQVSLSTSQRPFTLLYNFSRVQDVLLKHYHLLGERWRDTITDVVLGYALYLLSAALAQFLASSFATCVGIRHFFLKTKIHFKHIGIYFGKNIKKKDSNNKEIQKLKLTACSCNNFALQRPL